MPLRHPCWALVPGSPLRPAKGGYEYQSRGRHAAGTVAARQALRRETEAQVRRPTEASVDPDARACPTGLRSRYDLAAPAQAPGVGPSTPAAEASEVAGPRP